MLTKKHFFFIALISFNLYGSNTCDIDLTKAFDREIISNSSLVKQKEEFHSLINDMNTKGIVRESDLNEINEATSELMKIQEQTREKILRELNPNNTRSGRQFESQVNLELNKRLQSNQDYQDWVEIQHEARVDLLLEVNQNLSLGRRIDFTDIHTYQSSVTRMKSLDGIEPADAQDLLTSGKFPKTIYRFDNNFSKTTNNKGLPKASLITQPDGRRSLKPVNPNGDGTITNHVAADNAQNRSASPYISFGSNADKIQRFAEKSGKKPISIKVKALLEAIASGKLKGVDLITPNSLRWGAQAKLTAELSRIGVPINVSQSIVNQIKKLAKSSNGHLTNQQSNQIQGLINEALENSVQLDLKSKEKLVNELKKDIDFLRHAITNDEVLIRGSIPEEYLSIPKNI